MSPLDPRDHETYLGPHDPRWENRFRVEAAALAPVFGEQLVAIEHIGSTAVSDLRARPIIDIAVLIRNKAAAEDFMSPVEQLGYSYTYPSAERHWFRKGNPTAFHLSVGYADFSRYFERQVLFRDYLREHAQARHEYEELKESLWELDPTGGDVSTGKLQFVMRILEAAGFDFSRGW